MIYITHEMLGVAFDIFGKLVANAIQCHDILWLARVGLDLTTEVFDMGIYGTVEASKRGIIGYFYQLSTCKRAARLAHQDLKQIEFRRRQIDWYPIVFHGA